jgi:hypothetical protein
MPGMTLPIAKQSELHKRVLKEIGPRIGMAEKYHSDQHEKWKRAEELVSAYVPESADDRTRRWKREKDGRPAYTTIQIPYSYALLMAAHTYWTSVFFARSPVHQFSGRHGETETQVQGLEAMIAYQTQVAGHLAPYYLWLYDAGKYGAGILGTYWDQEMHQFSQLMLDESGKQVYSTNRVTGYKGNKVYNISPWDFLPDPRVPINRFQEGEFCIIRRRIPWNQLISRMAQGYYVNTKEIKSTCASEFTKSQMSGTSDNALRRPAQLELTGADDTKHPSWVEIYECYVDLIPDEWGLGTMKFPEKWVFTVTGDKSLVIGAQPLGLAHNRYPVDVIECEVEAYGLWNRGIPETIEPIQNVMDWLINAHFYNVRAVGNGRFIADPSRINVADLERGDPGFVLQLRPEAFGSDVREVFQQLQTVDVTANHMNDFQRMFQIGEQVFGINEQVLGALSGGGRKTATEVRTSASFGVNRLKTMAEYMSSVGMTAHATKLVQHTQQFQDEAMTVKIVGDLTKFGSNRFVNVTPDMIAGFFDFVPVDGTLPIDRFAQATLWKDILGQISRFPQIMQQFDLGKIFAWMGTLAGVKNMDQFRLDNPGMGVPQVGVQVAPDEELQREAERGNVIPYTGGAQPAGAGTQTNRATVPSVGVA